MSIIQLSVFDLALASVLVLALALIAYLLRLGLTRSLLVAGARTAIQLSLIGLVLKVLFDTVHVGLMSALIAIMLGVASYEVLARQNRPLRGVWGVAVGSAALFSSAVVTTLAAVVVIIGVDPWYTPQYLVPLLGMLLGNTMNGIAIGLERLTAGAYQSQREIEAQLMLGHDWRRAIAAVRHESLRAGFIPIVNGMAAAGIVSLPGMMTGQILAGNSPVEATKYQILIMFMVASGTGFGVVVAVLLASRRLFDDRQRLRLDRLRASRS